jgi:hypothetical protein
VPGSEAAAGCATSHQAGLVAQSAAFELAVAAQPVDVHLNLDTTESMVVPVDILRDGFLGVLWPAWQKAQDDIAVGLARFEDFPFAPFGEAEALPFDLMARVSRDGRRVAESLSVVSARDGGDSAESGLEAIFQAATGAGVSWPGVVSDSNVAVQPARVGLWGHRDTDDVDDYLIEVGAGAFVSAEVYARRVASGLDAELWIYTDEGQMLAQSDDVSGLDPALGLVVSEAGTYRIRVASCCGGSPAFGDTRGDYQLTVLVDGLPYLPETGLCSALETGGDSVIEGDEAAARLLPATEVWPYDTQACTDDCLAEGIAASWAASPEHS